MKTVLLFAATPLSPKEFKETLLGKSLEKISLDICCANIIYGNTIGLPTLYNKVLKSPDNHDKIVLFVHHDVSLEDAFLVEKLNEAIEQFDIVGLAGGSSVEIKTPALWHLMANRETWSGSVAHKFPDDSIRSVSFGPSPKRCLILDGLFLAVNVEKVVEKGLQFNPDYEFHHYDIQFGLDANRLGLKSGTWPIWVVHSGLGDSYQTNAWKKSEEHFLKTNS